MECVVDGLWCRGLIGRNGWMVADFVQESVRQSAGRGEGEGGFGKEGGWCTGRWMYLGVMRCFEV